MFQYYLIEEIDKHNEKNIENFIFLETQKKPQNKNKKQTIFINQKTAKKQ